MQIPESFDCNMFEILHLTNKADLDTSINTIGSSEAPYCIRKNVLCKIHGIEFSGNNKTLFGKLYEEAVSKPETLKLMRDRINSQLGITEKQGIIPQMDGSFEILPGKKFRITSDVFTSPWSVEIKTTSLPLKVWTKELVAHQVAQLNATLGRWKQEVGFLHMVNWRVIFAKIKEDENYWTNLWNSYAYFIPVPYDHELFIATLKRVILIFKCIDEKKAEVNCPEMKWECGYCPVLYQCGKEMIKCRHRNKMGKLCQTKMYEWESCLTDKFIDEPICKNCWTKEHPRMAPERYEQMKYQKEYPWSE